MTWFWDMGETWTTPVIQTCGDTRGTRSVPVLKSRGDIEEIQASANARTGDKSGVAPGTQSMQRKLFLSWR